MTDEIKETEETEESATEEASEATEETSEVIEEASETAEEASEAAEEASEAAEEAEEAAEEAEEAAEEAEEAAEEAEEAAEEAEEAAEEAEEAVEEAAAPADTGDVAGIAAYFEHPAHLLYAAEETRDSQYEAFDAFSPFPIHGMDDALGVGRSWIPWVTFAAGATGFLTAVGLQFGIMGFDWPMVFGGKPFIAWPSFVPIMFELTVLLAGVTTGVVMLKAAGCFQKPFIIDPDITNDQFVLWIASDDERFNRDDVIDFMKGLNPVEIRTVRKDG